MFSLISSPHTSTIPGHTSHFPLLLKFNFTLLLTLTGSKDFVTQILETGD
jgi:hypothetical protein